MYFKDLEGIPSKEILSGFFGKFIHTDSMTFAFWNIKSGSILPEHSHVHEQVANLTEGVFELTIDGNSMILQPGQVAIIPSGVKHSGKAITDCKILDVFNPVREDYRVEVKD